MDPRLVSYGLAGFAVACIAATTRRRYVWVVGTGAVLVAVVLAALLWRAYAANTLTWNSCTHDCEGDTNPYLALAFVYLASLFGWVVGATFGLGVGSDPGSDLDLPGGRAAERRTARDEPPDSP